MFYFRLICGFLSTLFLLRFRMLTVVSSLLLAFLAFPGRSSGYDCHWLGTAPICDYGSCPSGYEFMLKAASATDTHAFGEFGSSCLKSTSVERDGKLLCCSKSDTAKIKDQFNVCEWRGTAPVCGSQKCRAGFTEVFRSGDVTVASKEGIFPTAAGFGLPCMQGYKTLCCKHSANPEWERSCEWVGRAPLCGRNDCPRFPPKVEFGRGTTEEDGQIAEFGSSCVWGGGSKTLCCNPK